MEMHITTRRNTIWRSPITQIPLSWLHRLPTTTISGSAFYAKEEYAKSLTNYAEVIRLAPQNEQPPSVLREHLSPGRSVQQDWEKWLADFAEAIRLQPKNAEHYNSRGNGFFAKEEYGPAIADYNKAIEPRHKYALLPAPRTATAKPVLSRIGRRHWPTTPRRSAWSRRIRCATTSAATRY